MVFYLIYAVDVNEKNKKNKKYVSHYKQEYYNFQAGSVFKPWAASQISYPPLIRIAAMGGRGVRGNF